MLDRLFSNMQPVVKNLLIINVLMLIAQYAVPWVDSNLALYPFQSEAFQPWQLVTHFFMHSTHSIMHIVFNMFALVMFGSHLERIWGPQRFLLYYFVSALGAALLHGLVSYLRIEQVMAGMSPAEVNEVLANGRDAILKGYNYNNLGMAQLNGMLNTPMVGASGAVFGILAGFAYLFPNTELMLMFPPIPIKAKWFVLGYAALELYLGFANNPYDNVAHFAHLGGALFGFGLVYYWQRNKNRFY
jgi:membrane associated rhomboid family serine protease